MKEIPPVSTEMTTNSGEMTTASGARATRRKVLAGLGLLSLVSIWMGGLFPKKRLPISCAPPEKKQTMKVLSQDGQLVEVDISHIKLLQEKISNKELQEWVKRT